MSVVLKRIYEPAARADGYRVLVDRLWPRGLRKADAALDEWCKEVAPSTDLRRWFGHDPQRWAAFRSAYRDELACCDQAVLARLRNQAEMTGLTLLFAARDTEHCHALVLQAVLGGDYSEAGSGRSVSDPANG
ncbi:MAG: hypothetical protein CMN28_10015 [Salinisphaeraceae bacterium]|jgi:uncharacterized protein YeaO (DUF488 family)|nr:hypothetical protein [Salinisphaeraceae bacterium]